MLEISNITKESKRLIDWIKIQMGDRTDTNAVIGISGGKDSTIAAALCVEALGKDRVIGVLMPDGEQSDFVDAMAVVQWLGIAYSVIDIHDICEAEYAALRKAGFEELPPLVLTNTPPRVRMATLYNIAQMCHGRVVNTSNLSERYVGWSTKWGDGVGDFAPFADLTVNEVLLIGKELGVPKPLLYKAPADGLTGKTDEENLGASYAAIDSVIRKGPLPDVNEYAAIVGRHKAARHKENCVNIPKFCPTLTLIEN